MKKQIKKPKEAHLLSAAERRLYAAAFAAARKTNAAMLLRVAARETLLDYMENQAAAMSAGVARWRPAQMDESLAKCWAREQAAWHAAENPGKRK